MRKYNLTEQDFVILLKNANNACQICNNEFKESRFINIDHCHKTGKIRGVLCTACNTGIGQLKDDVELLKKAIEYLQQH